MTQEQALNPATTPSPDNLDGIMQLAADDMARVNACIREALASDVVLIDQVMHYIVGSGGKRLRPLLLPDGKEDGRERAREGATGEEGRCRTRMESCCDVHPIP